jgi:glycosyltransferase involved in cell wall biosynthesis
MKKPNVSVLIPAYNHERYVGEAIQSVLDQTYQEFELIIINDGSTDSTETEILKFKDDRIHYYSQENQGLSATLNRGIELARGEYFNFLPSDDAFFPEKLEVQLKVFEETPGLGVVFSYPRLVDADGREIKDDPAAQWPIVPYETKEEIFPALFERNFLSAPTALIRMDCFKKVGLFDESLKYAQDYDLWMRILKYYDTRLLRQPLVKYRWHGKNLTRIPTQATEQERARLLMRANQALSLKEIFPSMMSLNEADYPGKFAQAYHQLADFFKKSGLKDLASHSEGYEMKAKGLEVVLLTGGGLASFERGASIQSKVHLQSRKTSGRVNILMQTRSLDKGGLEEVIYNIAKHIHQDLFNLVIVCTDRGGATAEHCKRLGIPVEVLKEEKEREYQEILSRYEIDLLVTHFSNFGLEMASEANIPVVCFLHNIYCWVTDEVMSEMKRADQKISNYIAVSEDVKTYSIHRFNIAPEKIRVIPNGIDLERLESQRGSSNITRATMGFNENDYLFLHVASFTPAKDHLVLLSALRGILDEYPEAKLLCVGDVLDKEYHQFIMSKVDEYGLKKQVRLLNFAEEMAPYYEMADAFVLPSLIEGWSLSMMEAMTYGLPLVLTRVGGAAGAIENNDIGILVDHRYPVVFDIDVSVLTNYREETRPNLSSLQNAMIQFLREREFWKKAGWGGKRKVRERLDFRLMMERYERVFVSAITLRSQIIRSELVEQRDLLFHEKERVLAEKESLLVEQERILKAQEDLSQKLSQAIQERGSEIQELRHLVESRYRQLDEKVDYVLLRMSIKERIKERLRKTLSLMKKFIPKPIKRGLRIVYYHFFPKLENKMTWGDGVPSYNQNEVYEFQLQHFRDLFKPKEIRRTHLAVMNQLLSAEHEGIVIYPPTINWEIPLFQRPHQIMRVLAERGYLCFFCVPNPDQDGVDGLKKVQENLYLCGDIPLLHTCLEDRKVILWSSNTVHKVFREYFHQAFLIYDYIDELNVFYGFSALMEDDHRLLVEIADLILATATNLFESVRQTRKDVLLVPNGVYLDDFKTDTTTPPFDLAHILKDGKPVIGYYGALAEWFDYDLINYLASQCKGYNFVLIGPNYDGSIKRLLKEDNLFWLGGKNYKELKYYLHFFDVATIPFKTNQITSSTSPLKLFEYMAGGKPIVTTNMKECKKYKSVLVAKDHEEFIEGLAIALRKKNDPEYLRLLRGEAEASSWHSRLTPVIDRLKQKGLTQGE